MNHWLTAHWPPKEDSKDSEPEGIWLPDGREQAGNDLEIGDLVLIYESLTRRPELRYTNDERKIDNSVRGKQGIIAIAKVSSNLKELTISKPTKYINDTEIWWRWHAKTTLISTNGFVPSRVVNRVLCYSPDYNMRGFGDSHSGLKKLNRKQFYELENIFKGDLVEIGTVNETIKRGSRDSFGRGESDEHRLLKEYIASNPSKAIGEDGLKTLHIEFNFPTQDRADIVLEDRLGRIIGLEVEVSIGPDQLEGILQAIKYRYMLALIKERKYYETRAFLVAYSISSGIKNMCDAYEVEYFTIKPNKVEEWSDKN